MKNSLSEIIKYICDVIPKTKLHDNKEYETLDTYDFFHLFLEFNCILFDTILFLLADLAGLIIFT